MPFIQVGSTCRRVTIFVNHKEEDIRSIVELRIALFNRWKFGSPQKLINTTLPRHAKVLCIFPLSSVKLK